MQRKCTRQLQKNLSHPKNENYILKFDTNAEASASSRFADTAPTSDVFSLGVSNSVNQNSHTFIAMLFASVEGISKCDGYSGQNSAKTVDCGFVPRLVIIKKRDNAGSPNGWLIFDTLRGINQAGSGSCYMFLSSNAADTCSYQVLNLLDGTQAGGVKGFSVPTLGSNNDVGSTYVYYAHS